MTGHRADGPRLEALAAAFEAARGALAAAEGCDGDGGTRAGGGARAEEQEDEQRGVSGCEGGSAMATDVLPTATPAPARGRSRLGALGVLADRAPPSAAATPATAARKPPRSRLAAMSAQKPSVPPTQQRPQQEEDAAASNDDDGAADAIAGLIATRLHLGDDAEATAEGDENAAPSTVRAPAGPRKAAGAARKVRFGADADAAAAAAEPRGPRAAPVAPPSVARHAVRRDVDAGARAPLAPPLPPAAAARPAGAKGQRSRLAAATASAAWDGGSDGGHANAAAEADGDACWLPSVVLVIDAPLHQLPWEACPGVASRQHFFRCPSLPVAAAAALRAARAAPGAPTTALPPRPPALDLAAAYFLLNPDGDLPATQAAFEPWLRGALGLDGAAGARPAPGALAAALRARDVFLYFGHGSGAQYHSAGGAGSGGAALRRLPRCAGALLMGCSSGRLRGGPAASAAASASVGHAASGSATHRHRHHYEPAGAIWDYLLAGCPAAVANLWDVTDRDIDRFGRAVLDGWLAGGGGDGNGGGGGGGSSGGGGAFGAAVAAARRACRLPNLIGAAPVVYGVPCAVDARALRRRAGGGGSNAAAAAETRGRT